MHPLFSVEDITRDPVTKHRKLEEHESKTDDEEVRHVDLNPELEAISGVPQ